MRVAIVGFGYMGQMYADLIKAENWELVGVHDTDNSKFNSDKFFENRMELISHPDVEAVIICTPHNEHLPILKECLKQKKHVLLEKPMGTTIEETEKIYKKIQKYKATSQVLVNITHCFYDNIQKAKELLGGCDVTKISAIYDSVVFPIKEQERDWWLFKKESVGHGVLLTNGCHLLARILHLFSEHAPSFEVVGGISSNLIRLGSIDDAMAHLRLHLVLDGVKKIPVTIFANWPMAKSTDEPITESMEVHTADGRVHIQAWNEVKMYSNPEDVISKAVPYTRDTIGQEISKGVKNVLKAFQDALRNKKNEIHPSVAYTYQAEVVISKFYAHFTANARDSQTHSRLVESLDCAL